MSKLLEAPQQQQFKNTKLLLKTDNDNNRHLNITQTQENIPLNLESLNLGVENINKSQLSDTILFINNILNEHKSRINIETSQTDKELRIIYPSSTSKPELHNLLRLNDRTNIYITECLEKPNPNIRAQGKRLSIQPLEFIAVLELNKDSLTELNIRKVENITLLTRLPKSEMEKLLKKTLDENDIQKNWRFSSRQPSF